MSTSSKTDDERPAAPAQRRVRTGNNTCAPSSKEKRLTKQLAGIMAHLEAHPNDALSRQRVATIKDLLSR
jgi:hypothetical protein